MVLGTLWSIVKHHIALECSLKTEMMTEKACNYPQNIFLTEFQKKGLSYNERWIAQSLCNVKSAWPLTFLPECHCPSFPKQKINISDVMRAADPSSASFFQNRKLYMITETAAKLASYQHKRAISSASPPFTPHAEGWISCYSAITAEFCYKCNRQLFLTSHNTFIL